MAEFAAFTGIGHRLGNGNEQYFAARTEQPTRLAIQDDDSRGDMAPSHGVVQVDDSPCQESPMDVPPGQQSPVDVPEEEPTVPEKLNFEIMAPGEATSAGISRAHYKIVCWDDVDDDTKGKTKAQWQQLFEKYTALVTLWQHKIKGSHNDEPLGPDFLDWCDKVFLMVTELNSIWSGEGSRDEAPVQMHIMRGVHISLIMWQLQTQVEYLDAAKDDSNASIAPVGDFQELDEGQIFTATPKVDHRQTMRKRWKPMIFEAKGIQDVANHHDGQIESDESYPELSDSSEPILAPQGKPKGKAKGKAKAKPSHVPRPKKRARKKAPG